MPTSSNTRQIRCDHGLRRQTIIESLLTDVFQGHLRAGQHLVTQDLAERFGTSHTPIREALIALAGIGIIELLPNRGATVRQMTKRDVREICQVRRALECEATRIACGKIPLPELQALRADLHQLKRAVKKPSIKLIAQARLLDSRLHDLIATHCNNRLLAREINRLKLLFRACRDLAWEYDGSRQDFHRLRDEADQHLAIVDALLASDRAVANRAMSTHIRSGLRYWSRALPVPLREPLPKQASRARDAVKRRIHK